MKIKDIWNKFLELRKSPTCIICAIIGILDVISCIFYAVVIIDSVLQDSSIVIKNEFFNLFVFILLMLFIIYWTCRVIWLWYYTYTILFILFIETMLKIKINCRFIENSKIYKSLWIIGAICFMIGNIAIAHIYLTGTQNEWLHF